ncbi:HEAT repeat domain-containing protein [Phormidium pseudopriestleyi FRX01]|uniref:HEAT repeat domain-containing protein n=1 Tax=Phormidium pseudopriestleyi FRX01 TaxID=1759528 RepID=A0ABS3FTI2_9CYAN|nr:HEAT repeat domain-containing protein [Phormidium pseudopriestleyi]MBO0350433.1 HEAT repeat domain-containing protein [Phormidium pseudopriestleyi FRX01]
MWDNLESGSPSPPAGEGETLTVEVAIANLRHEDLSLRYYAAWWIGRFGVREPGAIDALLDLLSEDRDQTEAGGFPLRRNAARALGKVGDDRAVPALIDCLDCSDYYVREAAGESLERLGDRTAIPSLMQLLAGGLTAAVQVQGKPHLTQPYNTILEALGTLQATEAIPLIQPFLDHEVPRVQYSAARAMYQLTGEGGYAERLIQALQGKDLQLRRSALLDLGAIAYLPAAKAISQTLAENSIKLIALKGLIEHHLTLTHSDAAPDLSPDLIEVMNLMDSLL